MWVQLHTSPLDLFSWGKAHTQHYTRLPSCRPCTAREDGLCWDSERSISASACKVSIGFCIMLSVHCWSLQSMQPLTATKWCPCRRVTFAILEAWLQGLQCRLVQQICSGLTYLNNYLMYCHDVQTFFFPQTRSIDFSTGTPRRMTFIIAK